MLTITLPIPPSELAMNGRANRFKKNRMAQASKWEAKVMTCGLMPALGIVKGSWRGPVEVTYTFHFRVDRDRDDDNAQSRVKWVRDGIADALGINDTFFRVQPVQWGARKDGTVDVHLVPASVVLPVKGVIG